MTLLSAFGGGLFIIPIGLFLAAVYSFYRGVKQSKSGSLEDGGGGSSVESNTNVPFWKCTGTVFGYIFLAFAIGSAIKMWLDK